MRWSLVILACYACAVQGAPPPVEPPSRDQELIAALIGFLDDGNPEVRDNIALALANLGESAAPKLLDALIDPKPERRMGAAMALGRIRPAMHSAVPALLRAMKDKDEGVRRQVSYALSRIVSRDSLDTPPPSPRPANVPPPDPTPSAETARGSR